MISTILFGAFLAVVLRIAYAVGVVATETEADIDAFDRGYQAGIAGKPNAAQQVRTEFGETSDRKKNLRHLLDVRMAIACLIVVWLVSVGAWIMLQKYACAD